MPSTPVTTPDHVASDPTGVETAPAARRPASRKPSAHTSTWASNIWCGDHHDQFIDAEAVASVTHRPRVARRQDRLRQHEADAAVVGFGEPDREREELGGRVRVRPAAVPAGAAAGRRRRHLREERRVAQRRRRTGAVPSRRRGRRRGSTRRPGRRPMAIGARVDVDTGQRRVATEGVESARGRQRGTARRRTPGRALAPVGRCRRRRPRTCRRWCVRRRGRPGRRACTRRPTACACASSIPSSAHRERRVRCRAGPVPPFRP